MSTEVLQNPLTTPLNDSFLKNLEATFDKYKQVCVLLIDSLLFQLLTAQVACWLKYHKQPWVWEPIKGFMLMASKIGWHCKNSWGNLVYCRLVSHVLGGGGGGCCGICVWMSAEFGYVLTLAEFEYSNSKIYSDAVYLQKSLNAADKISLFLSKTFCCIKPYTPPVLPVCLFVCF